MNLTSAAVILVALSPATVARAAVGLAYEAPDGCPTERQFVDAVATRGGDFEATTVTGARRVLVVAIRQQGAGFAGVFQVRDGESATNKREVQGASCAEVVDALAVVTAIALRPESAPQDPRAAPASSPLPVPPIAPPPGDVPLRGSNFVPRHPHESVTVPAGTVSFDLSRMVELSGGAMLGPVPSTFMPRVDLTITGASFVTTPGGAQRLMWIVRSQFFFFGPGTSRTADAKTELAGYGGTFGFCMTPHYDSAGLILLACFDAGVGLMNLWTTGAGGAPGTSTAITFGVAGLHLEAKYALTSRLFAGIRLGGEVYPGLTPEDVSAKQIFPSWGDSVSMSLAIGVRF